MALRKAVFFIFNASQTPLFQSRIVHRPESKTVSRAQNQTEQSARPPSLLQSRTKGALFVSVYNSVSSAVGSANLEPLYLPFFAHVGTLKPKFFFFPAQPDKGLGREKEEQSKQCAGRRCIYFYFRYCAKMLANKDTFPSFLAWASRPHD